MQMMRVGRRVQTSVNAEPNIVPFIDVMLVLLIIFMVAAPRPSTHLDVQTPPLGAIQLPAIIHATSVTLDAQGALFIDGQAVAPAQFSTRLLEAARARNPALASDLAVMFTESKIEFSADQSASYDQVFRVVNEIDQIGFKQVQLIVGEA